MDLNRPLQPPISSQTRPSDIDTISIKRVKLLGLSVLLQMNYIAQNDIHSQFVTKIYVQDVKLVLIIDWATGETKCVGTMKIVGIFNQNGTFQTKQNCNYLLRLQYYYSKQFSSVSGDIFHVNIVVVTFTSKFMNQAKRIC